MVDSGISRFFSPAQVAQSLSISVNEVHELLMSGQLRGARVGVPPVWRIEQSSLIAYLDDCAENDRRMALWRESNAASFPELWGAGPVRYAD